MRATVLSGLFAAIALAFSACGTDPVQPPHSHADTTSHNFSSRTFNIGESGSILYDVAVINDSLAYAVGEIYGLDSEGKHDSSSYGVAIWNGREWRLKRVQAVYRQGDGGVHIRASGVFAFSASDVWFAQDDVYQWNGVSDTLKIHGIGANGINLDPILVGSEGVIKIWGSSNVDLYAVGLHGAAAHFDGKSWRRIESGTVTPLLDVWGARDPRSGEQTVLCAAMNLADRRDDRRIIRLRPVGMPDTLARNSDRGVMSVWFSSPSRIFTAGEGIFTREPNGAWTEFRPPSGFWSSRVRGITDSDVFVVGAGGYSAHYNGRTLRSWILPGLGGLSSCDYKGRTCIAVGWTQDGRAAAVVFQR